MLGDHDVSRRCWNHRDRHRVPGTWISVPLPRSLASLPAEQLAAATWPARATAQAVARAVLPALLTAPAAAWCGLKAEHEASLPAPRQASQQPAMGRPSDLPPDSRSPSCWFPPFPFPGTFRLPPEASSAAPMHPAATRSGDRPAQHSGQSGLAGRYFLQLTMLNACMHRTRACCRNGHGTLWSS